MKKIIVAILIILIIGYIVSSFSDGKSNYSNGDCVNCGRKAVYSNMCEDCFDSFAHFVLND